MKDRGAKIIHCVLYWMEWEGEPGRGEFRNKNEERFGGFNNCKCGNVRIANVEISELQMWKNVIKTALMRGYIDEKEECSSLHQKEMFQCLSEQVHILR